jgi:hypothetical protein
MAGCGLRIRPLIHVQSGFNPAPVNTTSAGLVCSSYEQILQLRFIADEPFALVFDSNGIILRITKLKEHTPVAYTVLGWKVPDIHAAMKELAERDVSFERFPGMPQNDEGIMTFPDGAHVAWFKDPDGNLLSLTQLL